MDNPTFSATVRLGASDGTNGYFYALPRPERGGRIVAKDSWNLKLTLVNDSDGSAFDVSTSTSTEMYVALDDSDLLSGTLLTSSATIATNVITFTCPANALTNDYARPFTNRGSAVIFVRIKDADSTITLRQNINIVTEDMVSGNDGSVSVSSTLVNYTPNEPTDWNVVPNKANTALDELAQRINDAEDAALFLGFYADETALTIAHPTASNGNYAVLGSTDTVWIWDTGTVAWVDSSSATGDMIKATYDPTNVNGDAFSMDNMVEGATTKILTATERSEIAANTAKVTNATHTGDATGATALSVVKIQGTAIAAPVAGDDQKVIKYDHGTTSFVYGTGGVTLSDVNAWTGQQYFAEATLTYAASIAWNLNTAQTAKVTLTGDATLAAPTNMAAGATYILRVIQDATGGHTLSYNAAYLNPPAVNEAANAVTILTFYCDGTNMLAASNSGIWEEIAEVTFDATGAASQDVSFVQGRYKELEVSFEGEAGDYVGVRVQTNGTMHTTGYQYSIESFVESDSVTSGTTSGSIFGIISGDQGTNSVYETHKIGHARIWGLESGSNVVCFSQGSDVANDETGGGTASRYFSDALLTTDTNEVDGIRVYVLNGVIKNAKLVLRGLLR